MNAGRDPEPDGSAMKRERRNRKVTCGRWWLVALPLLLLGAAGWRLLAFGWGAGQSSSVAYALRTEVPQLDSFSRPSIASAVLQLEAERLFAEYVALYDQEWRPGPPGSPARRGAQLAPGQGQTGGEKPQQGSAKTATAIEALEELDATVGRLQCDLERKLLAAYAQNHLSDKFLDHYVLLLRERPDGAAGLYAAQALAWSRSCGRTGEVLEALKHLNRYQPHRKDAAVLRAALAEWAIPSSTAPDGAAP
jgi:hypothetical protein